MVEMINAFKGVVMMVADDRVEEYKAAGHQPVALSSAAIIPADEPEKPKKKRTAKK